MKDDIFWNLLAAKLTGEAGQTELQQLESFINGYPSLINEITIIEEYWNINTMSGDKEAIASVQRAWEMLRLKPINGPENTGSKGPEAGNRQF